ncbi:MAG: hypothetical protein MPEBLZ_04092 [Candidatus Methanoperedens nitroreducens]|uniref:Uncharacterized protein n=1 Tax=Candidatus Methanoperedens nitratireducens TaxID=1392998 RepID=A0A0N8KQ75_9EURY|nr:MAG: hypothetical protein MPEBLZ_04092 [Candidatus Methanoperedens sp. BLZ1]
MKVGDRMTGLRKNRKKRMRSLRNGMPKKENKDKDNSPDPFDKLRVLHTRRLLGPVEIPPELIEQAKQYSGDKATELWEHLESMGDVEIRELSYEGRHGKKDIFSFKISTPIHTYLDTGSREDIIELVENDIKMAAHVSCPACNREINYEEMDGFGNMVSPCGSLLSSIPTNFAKFSTELVMEKYGLQGIYTVLSYWDDLYLPDYDTDCDWLLIEKMRLKEIPSVAVTIAKPQTSLRTCTKRIPVFGSWEEDHNINGLYDNFIKGTADDEYFCAPRCCHCKYCIEVHDYAYFSDNAYFCAYPVKNNDFEDKIGIELSFDDEELRRYQENPEGIIKNAFMWAFLSDMKAVDRQTRDLEAKLSLPFNKFHGPICSEFDLNLEHMDLEDNGGPFRIVGEVDIVFGLPNIEEIKKEITLNEKRAKIKNLTDKAHALMNSDPNVAEMNRVRIEMNNINSDQALPLIRYLASNFTLHELHLAKAEGTLPINTSHKAYKKVIQKSIALKEKDSNAEVRS